MKDFKVGDLVTIDYGSDTYEENYGIIVKIDISAESNVPIYRVSHPNLDWIVPYVYHELKELQSDKPNGQFKVPNDLGANQKKDGKEGSEASYEDREWRHWGDK